MSKNAKKGRTERRKTPRSKGGTPARKAPGKTSVKRISSDRLAPDTATEQCISCAKDLSAQERALFVEEEIGRVFCSEDCITAYFQPEIERLEKEYFRLRTKNDLTPDEREQYAHLRWVTLQEPDEVWRQKTLSGDQRFTLISEFKPGKDPVWCVCTCLFLRGEPSFLYLAFPTSSPSLVNHFRRGERVEWVRPGEAGAEAGSAEIKESPSDGLAQDWSDHETLRAEAQGAHSENDIPPEEFPLYEQLVEKTLEEPDELWVQESEDEGEPDTYHFIRHHPEETEEGGVWYIIVATESEESEQLDVVDHFPTRSAELVQRFRKGRQELEQKDDTAVSRLVH